MANIAQSSPQQREQFEWGPRIDLDQVDDVFSPQTVDPYTPTPTGIDNLGITSTDVFYIPELGKFTVDFSGYVRVARSEPTSQEWANAEVYTNLIEMRMVGERAETGPIIVTLNEDFLSTGQIHTPLEETTNGGPTAETAKACRMAVGAQFDLPRLDMTLYNKEPIILTIDDVEAIPPAGNPGEGQIYRMLPLFDVNDPNGTPAAYLTRLSFAMGTYLTEEELEELRSSQAG